MGPSQTILILFQIMKKDDLDNEQSLWYSVVLNKLIGCVVASVDEF